MTKSKTSYEGKYSRKDPLHNDEFMDRIEKII